MAKLPIEFRKSSDILTTVDYTVSFTGVGYINFYLAGSTSSGGNEYFLTTDNTVRSDDNNYNLAGSTTADLDFDLEIEKPFTVAERDAIFMTHVQVDTGQSMNLTYTIYHVDSGGNETSIGATTAQTKTGAAAAEHFYETVRITMTRQVFDKGEKLRVNVSGTIPSGSRISYDPASWAPWVEGSQTYNTDARVLLPVEVDQ